MGWWVVVLLSCWVVVGGWWLAVLCPLFFVCLCAVVSVICSELESCGERFV